MFGIMRIICQPEHPEQKVKLCVVWRVSSRTLVVGTCWNAHHLKFNDRQSQRHMPSLPLLDRGSFSERC